LNLKNKITHSTFALVLVFIILIGLTIGLFIGKLGWFSKKSSDNRGDIVSINDSDSYRGLNIKTEPGEEFTNKAIIDVELSLDEDVEINKVKFEIEYWIDGKLEDKKYTKAKEINEFPSNFTQEISDLKSDSTYKYRIIIDGGYANDEEEFFTKFAIEELEVECLNNVVHKEGNSIRPRYSISYDSKEALDISNFKIRYYYTIDSEDEQTFWCDYAGINTNYTYSRIKNSVKGEFVKMENPTDNADYYLELTFEEGLDPLQEKAKLDVYCRFSKNDWSNYNQENDYSYTDSTSYIKWDKIVLYYKDELVYGEEPK
jgi:hypothetical protein